MTSSIWNVAKIDADTDAAIADHAREPHELPRVGTMVVIVIQDSRKTKRTRIALRQMCGWFEGVSVDGKLQTAALPSDWHYATPEQRRVAWGGGDV